VPVLCDLVGLQYICREPNGEPLVGNSDHSKPQFVDPDSYPDRADDDAIETVVTKLGHRRHRRGFPILPVGRGRAAHQPSPLRRGRHDAMTATRIVHDQKPMYPGGHYDR
jgi:hypothetical protein